MFIMFLNFLFSKFKISISKNEKLIEFYERPAWLVVGDKIKKWEKWTWTKQTCKNHRLRVGGL